MRWEEFARAAPGLASVARSSLATTRLALLGTVRSDGSPRISPIEPYFAGAELLIGAMSWSRKAVDLSRDTRLVLHNLLSGPDNGEPEIKLYGRALPADPATRASCPDAWWADAVGRCSGATPALSLAPEAPTGAHPRRGRHHVTVGDG